jgi:RNA polymerase sigma-70 factor, ECF subfamily
VSDGQTDPARAARFEALVGRVHEPLVRYARRRADPSTADEVVADALMVLWRRLDDVPVDAELAWAYGVARRCLANARRAGGRRLRLVKKAIEAAEVEAGVTGAGSDSDPELDAALARLDPPDREVLRLWAWEQLEAREIAEVLDITANAASIRLHRAKQRLKDLLMTERASALPDTNGFEDRKEAP